MGGQKTTVTDADETLGDAFDALADPDCRAILSAADEPMTTSELADACDIALSTAYRKVERLNETPLLSEGIRFDPEGDHASEYSRGVTDATVELTDTGVRLTMETGTEPDEVVSGGSTADFGVTGASAD
ncbi:DNA-binding transcriptional ArsR family regulator [Halorubrum alkaliphilum]|uniref:DNA-binding transcriptional ArsR family regulator n=2 Tax=Halorubrum alkaliphilum TaxID=261290 RepID=A0A8T4GI83_9EURY|nr:helix-turn-helix domain-containing protein [Halorubrum alkaliphilum]MBP1922812.1 DNA-binding transcriptional ArsR family regulator [Halorubrum alkaliphilum]